MPDPTLAAINLFPARVPFVEPGKSGLLSREALQSLRDLMRYLQARGVQQRAGTDGCIVLDAAADIIDAWGTTAPENAVIAGIGSTYRCTAGGAGTTLYVKEANADATGWVGK